MLIVNNTNADIRCFEADIREAVKTTGDLPEELKDVFMIKIVEVEDEKRIILDWA